MEFQVQRRWKSPLSTIGEMTQPVGFSSDVSVPFHAFTLEPPLRWDDVKPRAIPAGRYRLTWRYSPDHNRNVPHIEDVPGFVAIEIHAGNFPRDTKGCTCVGASHSREVQDYIGQSQVKRDELYAIIERAAAIGKEMWITYIDPPQPEEKSNAVTGS
jgi:hypothetical protein